MVNKNSKFQPVTSTSGHGKSKNSKTKLKMLSFFEVRVEIYVLILFYTFFDRNKANPDANKFTPSDLATSVKEKFNKKIGLVLDLTFTSR